MYFKNAFWVFHKGPWAHGIKSPVFWDWVTKIPSYAHCLMNVCHDCHYDFFSAIVIYV